MHGCIHDKRKNSGNLFQTVHGEFKARGDRLYGYNLGLTEKSSLQKVSDVL